MCCDCYNDGYVDIEIYQVVMGISADYPSVSLSLPRDAVSTLVNALNIMLWHTEPYSEG
jgi:hypothetical protein